MKKVDLETLKLMLLSGANNLYNHHYEVDKLNVFPVPDGDTGTNMNLTMINGIKELNGTQFESLKEFGSTFSRGLIMGARGNSGVILSQIFRGFFTELTGNGKNGTKLKEIDAAMILKAWMSAKEFAYKAVMKPVEGTILTVVAEGAIQINENHSAEADIKIIFEKLLHYMQESLKRTPELLPILKKVGVVDSGGAGLVYIVEGMLEVLKKKKPIAIKKHLSDSKKVSFIISELEEFGYCSEMIVKLNRINNLDFNLNKTRTELEAMDGQSIVVIEDQELVKVHVHTLKPGQILNYMQQFGEFLTVKVENMTEQAKAHAPTIVEPRNLENDFALIACANGKGIENFLRDELRVNYTILYSNRVNPSTDDFLKAIERVDAKVVFIMPNDSNLVLTAKQAIKLERKSKVYVVETVNIAQGIAAALEFNNLIHGLESKNLHRNSSFNKIKNNIYNKAAKVSYGYLTIADRDTEIDNIKVKKNNYIAGALLRREAKIHLTAANLDLIMVINKLFSELIWNSAEVITIFKGKNVTLEEVYQITKILDEEYNIEYEFIDGEQEVYHFLFAVE